MSNTSPYFDDPMNIDALPDQGASGGYSGGGLVLDGSGMLDAWNKDPRDWAGVVSSSASMVFLVCVIIVLLVLITPGMDANHPVFIGIMVPITAIAFVIIMGSDAVALWNAGSTKSAMATGALTGLLFLGAYTIGVRKA